MVNLWEQTVGITEATILPSVSWQLSGHPNIALACF